MDQEEEKTTEKRIIVQVQIANGIWNDITDFTYRDTDYARKLLREGIKELRVQRPEHQYRLIERTVVTKVTTTEHILIDALESVV